MLDQADRLRTLAKSSGNFKRPKIITVTSGKGGVGKSNFVVNMSIAIQKMGKNVLILDADVGMGNDDVLMGFMPRYNIFDVILKDMKIEDVVINGPFGVKLLPAGSGLNKIEELSEDQREGFIEKLTALKEIDYIILDTGAGINRSVLGFIACCEELIVIITPEPTSLTDAYSLLKAVNYFKLRTTSKVVINRVVDNDEGLTTFQKFNNAANTFLKMNLEYLGSITDDKKLVQSVRQQVPFIIKYPSCSASLDIQKLAVKLMGSTNSSTGMGVQGFFKKLFSIFS